ncbi:MAG: NADH-quinone oxidoreductase subunit L [Nitriliruptoraceae bacterium]
MSLLAVDASGVTSEVVETTTGVIGLAWLIPVIPLLGFVVILAATRWLGERAALVSIAAALVSLVLSIAVAVPVLAEPTTHLRPLWTWIDVGGFTVAFDLLIDQLTVVMLLVVTGVGSLVHVYSVGYMHGDERYPRFFAYLNLFLASMLILVLGESLLVLFLGWELVGLSSYLLIGFWFESASNASAAKKAFVTNRVGDVAFMVGLFLTFATFGTLEIVGVIDQAEELSSATAFALVLLFLGGAVAKSAQIPLHVWLPDAMAGPTPVSALIHAATMVTAGVYLTVRLSPVLVQSVDAMEIIAWIGALTALLGALIAIRQDDIKKILAYSTISQLGYMFLGVGVGAFREGIFHLVTHAFFKGLLFLAAGSVMHAMNNRVDVWRMGGLRRAMPITFWTSAVAWLTIAGVPPFAGFFSKDQIINEAYAHGYGGIYVIGLLVGVLTAFYMSRWFFLVFLGRPRYGDDVHPHESPRSMTVPLIILAVASALGGLVLNPVHSGPFYTVLEPAVAGIDGLGYTAVGGLGEPALMALAIGAALLGIALAYLAYLRRDLELGRIAEPLSGPVAELMERRFFVDEAYEAVFTRFGGHLARLMVWFDTRVIDGVVNGVGSVSVLVGRSSRRVQSGLVRGYVGATLLGAIALVVVLLVQVV